VDGLPVDRPGAPQRLLAGRGEHGEARPAVGLVGLAFGQPGVGQLIHDPAHPSPAEHGALTQLAHPQPAVRGSVQFQQHVIPGQRHLARGPQIGLDRRHQPAVRHQQPAPCVDHRIVGRIFRCRAARCVFTCRWVSRLIAALRRTAARHTFRHGVSLAFACVREHTYYVRAHALF